MSPRGRPRGRCGRSDVGAFAGCDLRRRVLPSGVFRLGFWAVAPLTWLSEVSQLEDLVQSVPVIPAGEERDDLKTADLLGLTESNFYASLHWAR